MSLIEGVWEVAIDGRPYRAVAEAHQRGFLDVMRQQADAAGEPSERSLNPNDLWRRSQSDWLLGSGQEFYDDEESVRKRYNSSFGVNPWVKGQLGVLPSASRIDALTGDIKFGVVADSQLFVAQTTTLAIWDGATWTATSAVPEEIRSIASDGTNVYIACRDAGATAGGVYVVSPGSTTPVLLNTVIPDLVAYVRGRLMVAAGAALYNITDVGTTDPPLALTAAAINEDWEWTAFGEGQSYIYVAGRSGDLSLVYRISIREDGTALTAPAVASQMPDGEFVNTIQSYLGVVLFGTSKGLRIGLPQAGALVYGSLIETDQEVCAVEPQGNFVWFGAGWPSGSLGRADLSRFIENLELTPAHAADLYHVDATGKTSTVLTWGGRRLWVSEDAGVFWEDAAGSYVTDGELYSGKIDFGLPSSKQFRFLNVDAELTGSDTVVVSAIYDGSLTDVVGTLDATTPSDTFELVRSGVEVEILFEFTGSGTTNPLVKRFTIRALPTPDRTEQVNLTLDLRETLVALNGSVEFQDFFDEYEYLQALVRSGEVVDYQEFGKTYRASLENVKLGPDLDVTKTESSWEGPCVVVLRIYSGV